MALPSSPVFRRRSAAARATAWLAALLAVVLVGCGQIIGSSPAPTPADFPGIAGVLARRGIAMERIASGDAGCSDAELARTAIRFSASGLDQAQPIVFRIYIFRDRGAYDRRRSSVDACARAWITDAAQLVAIDAVPFTLIGQGPVGQAFAGALRSGLYEAAGIS